MTTGGGDSTFAATSLARMTVSGLIRPLATPSKSGTHLACAGRCGQPVVRAVGGLSLVQLLWDLTTVGNIQGRRLFQDPGIRKPASPEQEITTTELSSC